MDVRWEAHITSDPAVMVGKPVVKGTRLTVEHVLDLLASGWSEATIIENYPQLSEESIRAVLRFAAESMRDLKLFPASANAGS
ncbi:MAG: DUF433 domain-containing protein [Dehalococcoidia bacterium]